MLAGALATGLGPTAVGYFIQGWFKFGGFEYFKITFAKSLGDQKAWDNRNKIYMGAAGCAEFIADIFLCPLEAARIRAVSDPTFTKSTIGGIQKLYAMEGLSGWYSGFVPMLFKQIPYTIAKFAVQGAAAEQIYNVLPARNTLSKGQVAAVSRYRCGLCNLCVIHPRPSAAHDRLDFIGRYCRRRCRHHLAPGRHAVVQGEQEGCWWHG